MAGKEIRIRHQRFRVLDWSERFEPEGKLHACGKRIVGTFRVSLPQSVGIGSIVEMEGGERRAIVDDGEAGKAGEFLMKGSILAAGPGTPLAEPPSPPPQA